MSLVRRFLCDETGGSVIEHALIAGMIACVIINGLQALGTRLTVRFSQISNALS